MYMSSSNGFVSSCRLNVFLYADMLKSFVSLNIGVVVANTLLLARSEPQILIPNHVR